MVPQSSTRFLTSVALLALAGLCWPTSSPGGGAFAANKKEITVTVKIADKTAGFSLEARKVVAADANAFDVMRHMVAVAYRTDSEAGPVITSLCGVAAPRGFTWVPYLDGKPCKGSVARLILTKD